MRIPQKLLLFNVPVALFHNVKIKNCAARLPTLCLELQLFWNFSNSCFFGMLNFNSNAFHLFLVKLYFMVANLSKQKLCGMETNTDKYLLCN